ncbi:hypothetical protein ATCC90586_011866 [Pythium insidiosum]|nr:hypothetical protein ATCC90586_011866 [Pythium insidiosum]
MTKAAGGLADEDEVRRVAEQYIGKSKAEVTRMQEDIYLKDSIISGLERYVQELADERDAAIKQKALLAAPNGADPTGPRLCVNCAKADPFTSSGCQDGRPTGQQRGATARICSI